MKTALLVLTVLAMSQAGSINLRSHVLLPTSNNLIQETRQFNFGPLEIANAISQVLKIFNFTPSVSQGVAILNFATRLYGLLQRVREGTMAIQTAFNNISKELAKIFNCQDNPKQMDGVVTTLMQTLGFFNGGKLNAGQTTTTGTGTNNVGNTDNTSNTGGSTGNVNATVD